MKKFITTGKMSPNLSNKAILSRKYVAFQRSRYVKIQK